MALRRGSEVTQVKTSEACVSVSAVDAAVSSGWMQLSGESGGLVKPWGAGDIPKALLDEK